MPIYYLPTRPTFSIAREWVGVLAYDSVRTDVIVWFFQNTIFDFNQLLGFQEGFFFFLLLGGRRTGSFVEVPE